MTSHQAKVAKKIIQDDLLYEKMHKKKGPAHAFCKTCTQYFPIDSDKVVFSPNGKACSFVCPLCTQKEENKRKEEKMMNCRAELIRNAVPVQPKLSFADMAKMTKK